MKHESLIENIKYQRKIKKIEKEGGDITQVKKPKPKNNYKQCQYCFRKFRPDIAIRHISRCKEIKKRPLPPKYLKKPPIFNIKKQTQKQKMSYTLNGEVFKQVNDFDDKST